MAVLNIRTFKIIKASILEHHACCVLIRFLWNQWNAGAAFIFHAWNKYKSSPLGSKHLLHSSFSRKYLKSLLWPGPCKGTYNFMSIRLKSQYSAPRIMLHYRLITISIVTSPNVPGRYYISTTSIISNFSSETRRSRSCLADQRLSRRGGELMFCFWRWRIGLDKYHVFRGICNILFCSLFLIAYIESMISESK